MSVLALLAIACLSFYYHLPPLAHAQNAASPTKPAQPILFCRLRFGLSHQERVAEACARIAAKFGYHIVHPLPRLTSNTEHPDYTWQGGKGPKEVQVDVDHYGRQFCALWDRQGWAQFVQSIGTRVAHLPLGQRIVTLDRVVTFHMKSHACVTTFIAGHEPKEQCTPITSDEAALELLAWALTNVSTVLLDEPWISTFLHHVPGADDWLRTPSPQLRLEAAEAQKKLGKGDYDCLHARVEVLWAYSCCNTGDLVKCARENPSCYKDPAGIADWLQHSASPQVRLNQRLFICSGANISDLAPLPELFQVLTLPSKWSKSLTLNHYKHAIMERWICIRAKRFFGMGGSGFSLMIKGMRQHWVKRASPPAIEEYATKEW